MICAIIVIVLLCFSLFLNFAQSVYHNMHLGSNFAQPARDAGPQLEEVMLKDNNASDKIAVVTVDGIITSHTTDDSGNSMVDITKAALEKAKKDPDVKAIILKVDSPGGEVLASDDIYRAIRKVENDPRHGKPVICSMGSLAASGGYYISSPCRWIVANPLTLTGSIGVIMETINYRGLMDKIGVAPYVFKSGKYKDMLSGMRSTNEIPPGEHAMVQGLIDQTYDQFKHVVAQGRDAAHEANKDQGEPLASDWTNYADGRVLSGDQALHLGLVDQLGDFQDAVDKAKEISGIGKTNKANLVEYQEIYNFSQFLQMFGQSGSADKGVKLDLGFDAPKLEMGELYFLYLPVAD